MQMLTRHDPARLAARLARHPWFQLGEPVHGASWTPALDIVETADAYRLSLELPGVERDRVEVTFDQGLLRVTGERSAVRQQSEPRLRRVERSYGAFERSVKIRGPIQADAITACFRDGVMTITLPKAAEAVARHIQVTE